MMRKPMGRMMANQKAAKQGTVKDGRWRSDGAPVGRVVEVWYVNAPILAVWHGDHWRTVDGSPLAGVSHWRLKAA